MAVSAAHKWEYDKAKTIFEKLADEPGPHRYRSEQWLKRIRRICAYNDTITVQLGDTWELLALRHFNDVSLAAKLAAYNNNSIIFFPTEGETILIPVVHREAALAWQAYEDPKTAPLADLASGISHMRRALDIDPEYPDLQYRLRIADRIYAERTTQLVVDSLTVTVDSLVNAQEYTEAIQNLQQLQQMRPTPERSKQIRELQQARRQMAPRWFDEGNRRFREGDLEGALKAWKKVYEADPSYRDVASRIEKAETMRETLEQ
ncbi:hypothetical protein GF324_10575 [bacterium]|nr:hypothetical protein [bacterium]